MDPVIVLAIAGGMFAFGGFCGYKYRSHIATLTSTVSSDFAAVTAIPSEIKMTVTHLFPTVATAAVAPVAAQAPKPVPAAPTPVTPATPPTA